MERIFRFQTDLDLFMAKICAESSSKEGANLDKNAIKRSKKVSEHWPIN